MASGTEVARLYVSIAADLSEYKKGLKDAEKQADTFGVAVKKSLNATFGYTGGVKSTAGAEIKGIFKDLATSQLTVRNAMRDLGEVAAGGGQRLKDILAPGAWAAHKAMTALHTVTGGLVGALKEMGKGALLGAGFMAFTNIERDVEKLIHLIPELIDKGKEYGQQVADIVHTTGASGEAASKLAASIRFLDPTQVTNIIQLMSQFAKNVGSAGVAISQTEKKLNHFGISIRDENGVMLNQVDLLERIRSGLSRMQDGTAKAGLIASMTGRGGMKVFNDYLRISDEQMQMLVADFEKQGLILTTKQAELAENAEREGRRMENALTGLGAQLFLAVGPQINAFVTMISDAITSHLNEIVTFVGTVITTILGFVQGLLGATNLVDSFTSRIGEMDWAYSATHQQLTSYREELVNLKPPLEAITTSTKGQTDALDKQIAALDKLDAKQQATYKAGKDAIDAELDSQLKLLDAQDQAVSRAQEMQDAAIAVAAAQEALRKAQEKADPNKRKPGETYDPDEVAKLRLELDARLRDQAELKDKYAREDKRAGIQATKDYVNAVDKIVNDNDLSAASKRIRLKRLEEKLKAQEASAARDLELRAVLAAETRVEQQSGNAKKKDALTRKKELLQAELTASTSVAQQEYEVRKKFLEEQIVLLEKAEADQKKRDAATLQRNRGIAQSVGGDQGSIKSAFAEAGKAGQKFAEDIKKALSGLVNLILGSETVNEATGFRVRSGGLLSAIGSIVDTFQDLVGVLNQTINENTVGSLLSSLTALKLLGVSPAGLLALLPLNLSGDTPQGKEGTGQKDIDWLRKQPPAEPYDFARFGTYGGVLHKGMSNREAIAALIAAGYGKALGGWVGTTGPEIRVLGERGPEFVVPNHALDSFISMMSSGGSVGGQPVVLQVQLDGATVARLVDRRLAFLPRK